MKHRFEAPLTARGPGGSWVFVALPAEVSAALGSRGRVPVSGTINGFPFRTSALPDGEGEHYVAVNKTMQAGARVRAGDAVEIVLERDVAERVVEVPAELAQALSRAGDARAAFDALSYSHRKEYADWIGSAKRDQTRLARAEKALEILRAGRRLT